MGKLPSAFLVPLFTGKVYSQISHVSMTCSKFWRRKIHTMEGAETKGRYTFSE